VSDEAQPPGAKERHGDPRFGRVFSWIRFRRAMARPHPLLGGLPASQMRRRVLDGLAELIPISDLKANRAPSERISVRQPQRRTNHRHRLRSTIPAVQGQQLCGLWWGMNGRWQIDAVQGLMGFCAPPPKAAFTPVNGRPRCGRRAAARPSAYLPQMEKRGFGYFR